MSPGTASEMPGTSLCGAGSVPAGRREKDMDLRVFFKLKQAWETFAKNHPKVPPFISGIQSKGAAEGMEIAVAVRYPDGTEYKTGVRLTDSDMEILRDLGAVNPSDLQG